MGLSASQARLLTITARKSDCEYESMRLSHQKIALSRDMNIVSEEYQNSLDQTKLMWDFYGNDSQANDLNYNLLMSPSALNNFTPTPLTDTAGRVVLSPELAAAARAANIPQEGMDGLPSSNVRNTFIEALGKNGVITTTMAENIQRTTYNQLAGVGSADLVNVTIEQLTLPDLVSRYFSDVEIDVTDLLLDVGGSNLALIIQDKDGKQLGQINGDDENGGDASCDFVIDGENIHIDARHLTLDQFFNSDYRISIVGTCWDNEDLEGKNGLYDWSVVDKVATSTLWDAIFETVTNTLSTGDEYTDAALGYAQNKIIEMLESLSYVDQDGNQVIDYSNAAYKNSKKKKKSDTITSWLKNEVHDYIGYVFEENRKGKYNSGYGVNVSYMSQAYLTYFAMYMEGISNSSYNVDKLYEQSHLIDNFFEFDVITGADTSGDNMQIAGFYDALFNQICIQGWVENDQVNDQEYVQQMIKDGAMYLSSIADDGFYYQDNYSTNTYIKEVTDESKIAQAEAKYNREKEKINYKENILDMKMKNLDTEISALTTEYDTVKSVITKNIEKSFKRYDA